MTNSLKNLTIADGVEVPVDIATEALAIVGRRGMGKSHTARVLAEVMVSAGIPITVIDTVGVWWGLRSSADGKSPGLPIVIFGGDHADVNLDVGSGKAIAAALVETNQSAVLDVSGFDERDMRKFCATFLRELYRLNRTPRHCFFDEADELVPQRPVSDGVELAQAMNHILRRGRVRGLGGTLVSQRPALINKDVLSQAGTFIVHGLTGLQDVKTVVETISMRSDADQAAEVKKTLPRLSTGSAWIWSPEWLNILERVTINRAWTFDSSATPKVGEFIIAPTASAKIDLAALGKKIADAVERQQEDDPEALRLRVADLERELGAAQSAPALPVTQTVVEYVNVPALTTENIADLNGILSRAEAIGVETATAIGSIRSAIENLTTGIAVREPQPGAVTPAPTPRPALVSTPVTPPSVLIASPPQLQSGNSVALGRSERAILTVLATHGALSNQQVSLLSGYSVKSSGFNNALGKLRSSGFITGGKHQNTINDGGRAALGPVPALPQGRALIEFWMKNLGAAERDILEVLIAAWPEPKNNQEISEATGRSTTSSGFNNALGRLRSLQLISGGRNANYADPLLGGIS